MIEALTILGGALLLWFIAGLIMLAFMDMNIPDEVPWSYRLATAFVSGFILPWIFVTTGKVPRRGGIIAVEDNCQCPGCRARRGEG